MRLYYISKACILFLLFSLSIKLKIIPNTISQKKYYFVKNHSPIDFFWLFFLQYSKVTQDLFFSICWIFSIFCKNIFHSFERMLYYHHLKETNKWDSITKKILVGRGNLRNIYHVPPWMCSKGWLIWENLEKSLISFAYRFLTRQHCRYREDFVGAVVIAAGNEHLG